MTTAEQTVEMRILHQSAHTTAYEFITERGDLQAMLEERGGDRICTITDINSYAPRCGIGKLLLKTVADFAREAAAADKLVGAINCREYYESAVAVFGIENVFAKRKGPYADDPKLNRSTRTRAAICISLH